MSANYWSLIHDASGDRFACQREVNQTYETGPWHPTAEAAARELDELNAQAEEEATALERTPPNQVFRIEDCVMAPLVGIILALLPFAGLLDVLVNSLHFSWTVAIPITAMAVLLAVAATYLAVGFFRSRWPAAYRFLSEGATIPRIEMQFHERDSLPEFCCGVPAATIDDNSLFLVAKRSARDERFDTMIARFDRSQNAWRDQSGPIVRRLHHDDRWLLLEEHRDLIERASKRLGKRIDLAGCHAYH